MRRRRIFGVAAIAALVGHGDRRCRDRLCRSVRREAQQCVAQSGEPASCARRQRRSRSTCVYVDRTDSGDSFGDLSALPKYGNKTCIQGAKGAKGAEGATGATGATGAQAARRVTPASQGHARPGWQLPAARAPWSPGTRRSLKQGRRRPWLMPVRSRRTIGPNTVTLATVGPLTIVGVCGSA